MAMVYFKGCILGLASAISASTAVTAATEKKTVKQPNIVCIFADDHAWQAISA
jgi:hypothetical protein